MSDVHGPANFELMTLYAIRDQLAAIKSAVTGGMFLAVKREDGTTSFVNLAQAAQIEVMSEDECRITVMGVGVISVTTNEGVKEVMRLIGRKDAPYLPNSAPQPGQAQTK
jgi:hypothetical protein